MGMRYSLDAVKHHCRQRFEAIGLLHIIYLSLGDFRMLQRPGPLRGHTEMAVTKSEGETGQWCG